MVFLEMNCKNLRYEGKSSRAEVLWEGGQTFKHFEI